MKFVSFRDFVTKHQGMGASQVARLALKLPEDYLIEPLARQIEALRRDSVRSVEHSKIRPFFDSIIESSKTNNPIELPFDVMEAFKIRVASFVGTDKQFRRMTSDEHRARAEMLKRQAAGTLETADLHEKAAVAIDEAQVTNLEELFSKVCLKAA